MAVDCSAIDYISSAGVGALVEGAAPARRAGAVAIMSRAHPRRSTES
ncbi:MAG: hypothetical protein ABW318_13970 [Vicinamibacterales bacterium]